MSLLGMTVGAVIPAFNEEKSIISTVKGLKDTGCIDRIIVVDDGSSDNTAAKARLSGAQVIKLNKNMGKAYAMKTGYMNCTTDIIVFLDGDLGDSAREARKLIEPVAKGESDAVIAKFPMIKGKGGFGLVKTLSYRGVRMLTGRNINSVLSGQRAFKRSLLRPSMFEYKRFGIEFGMTVDLLNMGIKIIEIDVGMKHRTTGRDIKGFIHRSRQFNDILSVMVKKLVNNITK